MHSNFGLYKAEGITVATRSYFEEDLARRLQKLNQYLNLSTGCATLATVPLDKLKWGPVGNSRPDRSEFLELNGNRLMLWAIAEVVVPNFKAHGNNLRKPQLLFRPLLDDDFACAQTLLNQYSRPTRGILLRWLNCRLC